MSSLFSLILNPMYCDAPEPWQIGFQDGASPTFEGITELHNAIFFYLVVILVGVVWVMGSVVANFSSSKSSIIYKYANHGTLIELVWTITPAFILIAIAFPSFKLLYLMDSPNIGLAVLHFFMMPVKQLKSTTTTLVVYGNVGATANIRLNRICAALTIFPGKIMSQLVGHLLGDGSLIIRKTSINPYFVFTQTLKRFSYTWSVYQNLSHYCSRRPLLNNSSRNGVATPFTQVMTRSYPLLLNLYDLFYITGKGKTITWRIFPYLDDISLAYWAIDDGR